MLKNVQILRHNFAWKNLILSNEIFQMFTALHVKASDVVKSDIA